MQFGGGRPPVGVVFDSDMGDTIDDALALAMLYGLQGKGEDRVVGVSVSRPSLKSAEFADVLVRFYTGEPGPFSVTQPIGLALASKTAPDTPLLTAPLARLTPEGKPQYPRSIEKLDDTADPVALIRNNLSAQFDDNAIVVCTGPATDLAGVLDLPEARDLISRKVRYLVLGAGSYPDGPPESGIRADIRAARRILAEWPSPIVACGSEVGNALPFPASCLDQDFAWAPAHPLVDAYRAAKPMPYDAPSWAMAAALYAVRPKETYFQVSGEGTISVLDDGRTHFTAGGRHRYLIADPAQKDRVIQAYTQLASTHPVPRQRFRPRQKKKQE
jgi:inosine-uridine nucleoside N-ribohydrolase